jgi:dsDNA-binding SOS-regulon protein
MTELQNNGFIHLRTPQLTALSLSYPVLLRKGVLPMTSISKTDADAMTKAYQGASLLADDLKQLTQSENPLLAELAIQLLKDALDLEQRLKRLIVISSPA